MKKRIFIAILLLMTFITALFITACTDTKQEKWEYKVVQFGADVNPEDTIVAYFERELNKLGSDGWEFSFYYQGVGYIFKRQLP